MIRVSIFLITVGLIAGMVGCGGNGGGDESYTLTITSISGGSVTEPEEGTFTYDEGTVVNLVAEADEGYIFFNWTGNVDTIAHVQDAVTTITMNNDYIITANFVGGIPVWNWHDLDAVRDNLSGTYVLMNDLDNTTHGYEELASETANNGTGWQPIGTFDPENLDSGFTGVFDGHGYEIGDLFIERPYESMIGLFSCVAEGGVIQNVGVVNANVTGYFSVCSLAAFNSGTVSNCYCTGDISGAETVGGLVGVNGGPLLATEEGAIVDCYSSANVFGGQNGSTEQCAGGLVGINGGPVSNSYSAGVVAGSLSVGGLVGINGANVSNSYSTSSVTGSSKVGGLAGWNINTGTTISNSFSTGSVTGNSSVGGLVGVNTGTVSNSFWDTQTSGQATSAGGTGKTTAEMQDIDTFSGASWDIVAVANPDTGNPSYIWNIVDGETYPFLSWQSIS